MSNDEEVRRALGRIHDGEEAPGDASLAASRVGGAEEALLARVGDRLRERADGGLGAAGEPVPGLRDAVLGRLRGAPAPIHDLRPLLRRTAAAAAVVLVVAGAAAAWRAQPAAERGAPDLDALSHDGVVASLVAPRLGPDRAGR